MTTMKITIEDMGVTKTYEKDFGEEGIITVDDFFEACLAAYDAQGYVNDIDVNVYGLGGNVTQTISWDKDNYIQFHEEMSAVDDLMSFLEQGCEVRHHHPIKVKDFTVTMDGKDVSDMFKGAVDNWYMGHKY